MIIQQRAKGPGSQRRPLDFLRLPALALLLVFALLGGCSSKTDDLETLRAKAKAAIGARDYQTALDNLLLARNLAPTDEEILYFLGLSFASAGEPDSAISCLRTALKLHQPTVETSRALADIALQVENWDVALEGFDYLVKAGVSRDSLWDEIYSVHMRAGYYQAAANVLDSLIKLFPDRGEYYLRLGSVRGNLEEYESAEMILQELIRRFGPTLEAYSNIGVLYMRQSNYERAEIFFRKGLHLDTSQVGGWINLGNCLSMSDKPQKMREALRCYSRVTPEVFERMRLDTVVSRLQYQLGE